MPNPILTAIKVIYSLCMAGMALYGLSNIFMVGFYLKAREKAKIEVSPEPVDWPFVTIQLPMFNEKNVIARLLHHVTALDYPLEKLQIQILDDSTDETAEQAVNLVAHYRAQGVNIELVHRNDRTGFKAGALNLGLKTAKGEFIAIFDADFMPKPGWLKYVISAFDKAKIGCVQTRWGHVNYKESPLASAIALGLNGHFIVEQFARAENHLLMGFNGTAGIWRRSCIDDAGGWQTDTLTEDLDLSFRAELRGWQFRYLPEIVVPAQLPSQVEAFKKQQYRWAKGSIQTARKLLPKLLVANIPEPVRFMGIIQLCAYFVQLLMVIAFFCMIPLGIYAPNFFSYFTLTLLSSLGPPAVYLMAQDEAFPRLIDRLRVFPLLMLLGYGLSVNNSLAVLDGIISRKVGEFVRTPKTNPVMHHGKPSQNQYRWNISPVVVIELCFSFLALFAIYNLAPKLGLGFVFWMGLYAAGFGFVALVNIFQGVAFFVKSAASFANSGPSRR